MRENNHFCRGWLYIQYYLLEYSLREITELCNKSYGAIWKRMNKLQIPRRQKPSNRTIQKYSETSKGKNNAMYGKKHSEETRRKIGDKRKGKDNPMWKGDLAKTRTLHTFLRNNKPIPNKCEQCKKRKKLELSFNHKIGNYTRNFEDYKYLCGSCHTLRDIYEFNIKKGFLKERMK